MFSKLFNLFIDMIKSIYECKEKYKQDQILTRILLF